ncbi:TolC family outer membrane protein [Aestuariibius sp. 2305UL40-4]|uniref:TolC family outer membrane protein n=1 Tax=Aestuariibius violaceus TaxID=3234132 RepID=UPI00345F0B46
MRSLTFAGIAALTLAAVSGPARADTLADALVAAYENSGLLEQNRALLRAADEDVAQAVANLQPVIDYVVQSQFTNVTGGDFASNVTTTAQLSFELLLYDGGANRLGVDAVQETVLATRQSLLGIEQNVFFQAVSAYVGVREARDIVAVRQNNVGLISEELRAARDRFDVGEVTRTDVALAESRLAEARSELAQAQGALTRAVEEYGRIVGREPGSLQAPSSLPQIPGSTDEAKGVALRTHPDIRASQRRIAAAELRVDQAEARLEPRISLQSSIQVDEDDLNDRFDPLESVGVIANGTIYQGGRLSSQIRQAMASRDAERGDLISIRRLVEADVGNAYADLRSASASLVATAEQIRAADIAFQGVREEATLGARTTLDVLEAEQDLLDARTLRISAEADQVIAVYQVLQSMGLLTADHLGLGIQTYDPAAYYNLVNEGPAIMSEQGRALDRVLRAIGND